MLCRVSATIADRLLLRHNEPIFRPGSAANILVALAACGEVQFRDNTSEFFQRRDDDFTYVGAGWSRKGNFSGSGGTVPRLAIAPKTPRMGRPPQNSGINLIFQVTLN